MGVPSRTSAPTPALDQTTWDFRSSSGRCAPSRCLAEAHPQVLIIALLIAGRPTLLARCLSALEDTDEGTRPVHVLLEHRERISLEPPAARSSTCHAGRC